MSEERTLNIIDGMKSDDTRNFTIRLLCIVLLFLLFAYWLFVAGVVNVSIPEGSVGVVYTSTRGYSAIPERLVWSWKKIIPLNFKVYAFDNSIREVPFSFSGVLPNAAAISAMPQFAKADFRYAMQGSVQYRLSVEGLLWALKNHYLKVDGLASYYKGMDEEIEGRVSLFLSTYPEVWTSGENPNEALLAELKRTFAHLEFPGVLVKEQDLPNVLAYRQGMDFLNVDHQLKLEARKAEGQKNMQLALQEEQRLRLLERYGAILSKYPILVTFFAVDNQKILPRDLLQNFLPTTGLTPLLPLEPPEVQSQQPTTVPAPVVPTTTPTVPATAP